jgi:hypothetical protein
MGARDIDRTVVIGTHPDHDVSVVTGVYVTQAAVNRAVANLERKGWVTEVCPLRDLHEIGSMR